MENLKCNSCDVPMLYVEDSEYAIPSMRNQTLDLDSVLTLNAFLCPKCYEVKFRLRDLPDLD